MIELQAAYLDSNGFWTNPAEYEVEDLLTVDALDKFDQNGYNLTAAELIYAFANSTIIPQARRWEYVLRYDWFKTPPKTEGWHFNHQDLFERKGYAGAAREQLIELAEINPLLWKLIKMKPKWGIDVSIDYVDRKGNVFEVFHYEWDGFNFEEVLQKKQRVEHLILTTDWDDASEQLLKRIDEWYHLDFFAQSKWKTDYFGLEPEQFKAVIWDD